MTHSRGRCFSRHNPSGNNQARTYQKSRSFSAATAVAGACEVSISTCPSLQLASWIAQRDGQPVDEVIANLKGLLEFKTVKNLGYINDEVNKARRFSLAFKDKNYGIVDSHLFEVSDAFPTATFLLEYYDMQASYSGKLVVRAEEVVREVYDGNQKTQGLDWALPDIFAPFRAEYYGEEHEFGSLWNSWLDAITVAVKGLKDNQGSALPIEELAEKARNKVALK
jgi:hypothetical protein